MPDTDGYINSGENGWEYNNWTGATPELLDPDAQAHVKVKKCSKPLPGIKVDWNGVIRDGPSVDWAGGPILSQVPGTSIDLDMLEDTAQLLREKIEILFAGVSPSRQDVVQIVLPSSRIRILDKSKIKSEQGPGIRKVVQDGRLIEVHLSAPISVSGDDWSVLRFEEGALGFEAKIATCIPRGDCEDASDTESALSELFASTGEGGEATANVDAAAEPPDDDAEGGDGEEEEEDGEEEEDPEPDPCCADCDEGKLIYAEVRCEDDDFSDKSCCQGGAACELTELECGDYIFGTNNPPKVDKCRAAPPSCYSGGVAPEGGTVLTDADEDFLADEVEPGFALEINQRTYTILEVTATTLTVSTPFQDLPETPFNYCVIESDQEPVAPRRKATTLSCDFITANKTIPEVDEDTDGGTTDGDGGTTDGDGGEDGDGGTTDEDGGEDGDGGEDEPCFGPRIDTILIENVSMQVPSRVTFPFALAPVCTCKDSEGGPVPAPIWLVSWHYFGTVLPMQSMPIDALFDSKNLDDFPNDFRAIAISSGGFCGGVRIALQTLSGPTHRIPGLAYNTTEYPAHYGAVGSAKYSCEDCGNCAKNVTVFAPHKIEQYVIEDIIKPLERTFGVDFFDGVGMTTIETPVLTEVTQTVVSDINTTDCDVLESITTSESTMNIVNSVSPLTADAVTDIGVGATSNALAHSASYKVITSIDTMTITVCDEGGNQVPVTFITSIGTAAPTSVPVNAYTAESAPFMTDISETVSNSVTIINSVTGNTSDCHAVSEITVDEDFKVQREDPDAAEKRTVWVPVVGEEEPLFELVTAVEDGDCDAKYKWINRGSEILKLTIPTITGGGACGPPNVVAQDVNYENNDCSNVTLAYCNHVAMPKYSYSHLRAPVYDGTGELEAESPDGMLGGVYDVFATLEVNRLERELGIRRRYRAEDTNRD